MVAGGERAEALWPALPDRTTLRNMPITTTPTRPASSLAGDYDLDFCSWTADQAALLRAGRLSEADLKHIAEEIEDLGKSERRTLASHVGTVIEHLMKLQASPAAAPRDSWADTIDRVRDDIERVLEASPSLRRELAAIIVRETDRARRRAARELGRRGEDTAGLDALAFDLDRVLGPWFPDAGFPDAGVTAKSDNGSSA